jgi:putative flavoprotein involved in K+ transport
VIDDGRYRAAVRAGRPDRRPLFTRLGADRAEWPDGSSERIDVVLLATGYRPHLPFLDGSGALDADGVPMHTGGVSSAVPGLGFVGLERQRSFASATLRGVGRDAAHVLGALSRRPARRATARR